MCLSRPLLIQLPDCSWLSKDEISIELSYSVSIDTGFSKHPHQCHTSSLALQPVIEHEKSNSLDPGQVRHFVKPDRDPNCLNRLSAATY